MQKNEKILYGPLAICFAISFLLLCMSFALIIYLGGTPTESPVGKYMLSTHGQLTEVTHTAWIVASLCEIGIPVGCVSMLIFFIALAVLKIKYSEEDPRKDQSVVVCIIALFSIAIFVLAVIAGLVR